MKELFEFRRFDEEKQKRVMKDDYLFAFGKFDGFTHRLLNVDFIVDHDYNYIMIIHSFDRPYSYSQDTFYLKIEGKVTNHLQNKIKQLLHMNLANVKESYHHTTFSASGMGALICHINNGKENICVTIEDQHTIDDFELKVEKHLFRLLNEIDKWVEELYETLLIVSTKNV
ncbi:MAG: hypothetical protein QE487_07705 [Fluviicola sp.]|nr:hypothetical protein [Fluviicola sp.]